MKINDVHCHFFSQNFFDALGKEANKRNAAKALGWDEPGPPEQLAHRWVEELDRNGVSRCSLIASMPGDEDSVTAALSRYPRRFVGFFMLNPLAADAPACAKRALEKGGMRCICLYPAMHHFSVHDPRVMKIFEIASAHRNTAVFVHCGVLSVGVRKKLALPSRFDMTLGNPLNLHTVALAFPKLPIIIPHFGGGMFREALMVADLCPNILLDTSSSNGWIKYHPGLTLRDVFRQALEVVGPERIVFGTDSSFFPRGWQRPIYEAQAALVDDPKIFHGNFDRLFP